MAHAGLSTTALTDALLAALLAALGWRLLRVGSRSARLWGAGYGAAAVAAAAGSVRHGLEGRLSTDVEAALWLATAAAIGAAGFLLLAGAARAATSGPWRRAIVVAAAVKLAAYLLWIAGHRAYAWVGLDAALSMAVVVALLAWAARAGRFPGLRSLLLGLAVGFAGAAYRHTELDLHPSFDHNDLFHVIAMAALWLLYRAGRRLNDAGTSATPRT